MSAELTHSRRAFLRRGHEVCVQNFCVVENHSIRTQIGLIEHGGKRQQSQHRQRTEDGHGQHQTRPEGVDHETYERQKRRDGQPQPSARKAIVAARYLPTAGCLRRGIRC